MSTVNKLQLAADYYARRFSLPVFPVGSDKAPLTKNGHLEASTDPRQIMTWWTRHREAGIGLPTGKRSGIYVLDLDNKVGLCAEDILHDLEREFGKIPVTPDVSPLIGARVTSG